jgi:hypothetical protein
MDYPPLSIGIETLRSITLPDEKADLVQLELFAWDEQRAKNHALPIFTIAI